MVNKYCLIDNNGKFLKSFDTINELENKRNIIHTKPPVINEGLIAFWNNDSWKVRRRTPEDDIDFVYLNQLRTSLSYDAIKKNIERKVEILPRGNGDFISRKHILNLLNNEYSSYTNAIIKAVENNLTISQPILDYISQLKRYIQIFTDRKTVFTNYRYYDIDNTDFDLTELLPLKEQSDEELKKLMLDI